MFLNPPYKYACKSCKPQPCFKLHTELEEHFKTVHGMHELPPAPDSWYANTWRGIANTSTYIGKARKYCTLRNASMDSNPVRPLRRGKSTIPDLTERVKKDLEENLSKLLDRHALKCTVKERSELLQLVTQDVPVLVAAFARDLESDAQRGVDGPSRFTLEKHHSRVNAFIIHKMPANICFSVLF